MPVLDGVFVPRSPMTPAELHVDYLGHNTHVLEQRIAVEQAATRRAIRVAQVVHQQGDVRAAALALTTTLADALDRTAVYGYEQAQHELDQLRAADAVTAAANPPATPSRLSEVAKQGLAGVRLYVYEQAFLLADAVTTAAVRALRLFPHDETMARLAARKAVTNTLHRGVLDLVGSTLNLGRTVGAAELDVPPAFALRSEQLDKATCVPCEGLHGTIVRFGTPEYFAVLPPIGCLGGGRCRALMVFADGPRHIRIPEQIAA